MRVLISFSLLCIILAVHIANRSVLASHIDSAKEINETQNSRSEKVACNGTHILSASVLSISTGQLNCDKSSNETSVNEIDKRDVDKESGIPTKKQEVKIKELQSEHSSGSDLFDLSEILNGKKGENTEHLNINETDVYTTRIDHPSYYPSGPDEVFIDKERLNNDPLTIFRPSNILPTSNDIANVHAAESQEHNIQKRNSRLFAMRKVENTQHDYPFINPFIPIENKVADDKDQVTSSHHTIWVDLSDIPVYQSNEDGTSGLAVETEQASQPEFTSKRSTFSYILKYERMESLSVNNESKIELVSTSLTVTGGANNSKKTEEQN